jgi:S-adenosylhomocysteine hydrolase
MEIFQVLALASGLGKADFLTLATGNFKTFVLEHMKKVKNNAISDNTCHFKNEIEVDLLENRLGSKVENLKPQLDKMVIQKAMVSCCWPLAVW